MTWWPRTSPAHAGWQGLSYTDGGSAVEEGDDALLVVTAWREFRTPDFQQATTADASRPCVATHYKYLLHRDRFPLWKVAELSK